MLVKEASVVSSERWPGMRDRVNSEAVNHPKHYNTHPSGVECIQITEHMSFNLGNVIKYLWRYEGKNGVEDLNKAMWYLKREIERLSKETK